MWEHPATRGEHSQWRAAWCYRRTLSPAQEMLNRMESSILLFVLAASGIVIVLGLAVFVLARRWSEVPAPKVVMPPSPPA